MKKFIAFVLIISVLLLSLAYAEPAHIIPDEVDPSSVQETLTDLELDIQPLSNKEIQILNQQKISYDIYNAYTAKIGKNEPKYYGGVYLDENGTLVYNVAINELPLDRETKSNYQPKSIIGSTDEKINAAIATEIDDLFGVQMGNVIVKSVKYSNAYLEKIKSEIKYLFDNELYDIVQFAIDPMSNSIVVGVLNMDESKVQKIRESLSDAEPIHFFNQDSIGTGDIVSGGAQINVRNIQSSTGWSGGSLGFWARDRNNNVGFVTAAHNFMPTDDGGAYLNTTLIGTIDTSMMVCGGSVDAVFVRPAPRRPNDPTNTVSDGHRIVGYMGGNIAGTYVRMYGYSSINSPGRILNSGTTKRTSINGQIINFTDLAVASYSAAGGDSGGTVTYDSGTAVDTYLMGIHHGRDTYNGIANCAYFSKIANILPALNAVTIF